MKKQYTAPSTQLYVVESQPMMAASNPDNYNSDLDNTGGVKGSQVTSSIFQFLEEEGEE